MAIVPLDRVYLLAPAKEREELLAALQSLGVMHLSPRNGASLTPLAPEEEDAGRQAREALRYLADCRERRQQAQLESDFERDVIVERVLEVKRRTRRLQDRRDFLAQRLDLLAPWGDFEFPPGTDIGGLRLWFYAIPLRRLWALADCPLPWQEVRRDNRTAYVVVVAAEEPPSAMLPVARTHTGGVPATQLRAEQHRIAMELEDLAAERVSLTRWIQRLRGDLNAADDKAALASALAVVDLRGDIVVVHGWTPRSERERITTFAVAKGYACRLRPPLESEDPPTLLRNSPALAGGEAIVGMWQLPGYRDVDVSAVVAASFAAFFAMIMADAGYALLLAVLLALGWRSLARDPALRRLRALGVLTVTLSLLYGIAVGSYFGAGPSEGSMLASLAILDLRDYELMIEFSVFVGAAHLLTATGLAAWRNRRRHQGLGHLGWCLALLGGVGYWQFKMRELPTLTASISIALLCGGLALVLLFRGERRVNSLPDIGPRLAQGALALAGITKAFGDVLSYLRLFALGLASASLAVTFNQLAAQTSDAAGAAGPWLAILLLLFGHGLNFVLTLMGATIHGLRLNLIEFYGWAVENEGRPFKAFRRRVNQ
jgi:V/A-type H+-transporting ATPase subunit I